MFAGVAPFSIVIAKNSPAGKVYSNEINREANKYAKLNIELNNLKNKVGLIPGDIKRVFEKISTSASLISPPPSPAHPTRMKEINQTRVFTDSLPKKFDVIVMPRPQLKETFLKETFSLSKKGTRIFYYDFCKVGEEEKIVEKIKSEATLAKKKIKILKVKKAGEIAPYKIRVRVDFRIL